MEGPTLLLTLKLGVCIGPRIYLSVNNGDNYTVSQDEKGKNNKRKETEIETPLQLAPISRKELH